MHHALLHALNAGVRLQADGDDLLLADAQGRALRWRAPAAGWRRVLTRLAEGGADLDGLTAALRENAVADLAQLHYRLLQLDARGLLRRTLVARPAEADDRPLLSFLPIAPRPPRQVAIDPAARYRLSRFAALRAEAGHWELDYPLGQVRLTIHEPRLLAPLGRLASPSHLADLRAAWPELDTATLTSLLELLLAADVVAPCDAEGRHPEEADAGLAQWEAADLLFHAHSRQGRHAGPFGGTFPFLERIPPLPALKHLAPDGRIPLPVPNMTARRRQDPPFAAVVDARRSIRDFSGRRLHLDQLAEFLYRAARVEEVFEPAPERPYAVTRRPYPSAGAAYPLELYLAVAACAGLAPGLYHYDPQGHGLTPVSGDTEAVRALLEGARQSTGAAQTPPLLIIYAARFQRLSWKYRAMAYAALLKDVGVLFQQMYLAATVLGLAPCAVGAGDADLFARAAGTEYPLETSVGEFMLGGALTAAEGGRSDETPG